MTKNWYYKYTGKSLCTDVQEEESIDVSSPRDNNSPIVSFGFKLNFHNVKENQKNI